MKKQNTKNNRGITLIALVITIVVLLILAMVSIRLVLNGEIITHAENATNQYKVAQEKEKIALGYSEYKMAKYTNPNAVLSVEGATVTEKGQNGWTVEFEGSNSYDLNLNGEISDVEPYVPVVNPNPTEWEVAYAYDGTNWTKYTETDQVVGGSAEGGIIQGQIVAKFRRTNVPAEGGILYITEDITVPAPDKDYSYELYIEGSGSGIMPAMVDLDAMKGFGYNEDMIAAVQNNNAGNMLMPYVTQIKVCEGVTNIGEFAFADAINLEKIEIAQTVKTIDSDAFSYCIKLKQITIPYGVTEIGESAFSRTGLIDIVIPGSVNNIGPYAFFAALKNKVIIQEGVKTIEDNAFEESSMTSVIIPSSVTRIGKGAFSDCPMLKEIYLYTETCSFGTYPFENINTSSDDKINIYIKNPDYRYVVISGNGESKCIVNIIE